MIVQTKPPFIGRRVSRFAGSCGMTGLNAQYTYTKSSYSVNRGVGENFNHYNLLEVIVTTKIGVPSCQAEYLGKHCLH